MVGAAALILSREPKWARELSRTAPLAARSVTRVSSRHDRVVAGPFFPSVPAEAVGAGGGTIQTDHDLEKIVVGNEPAVSGGFGSQVITHNDDDAM